METSNNTYTNPEENTDNSKFIQLIVFKLSEQYYALPIDEIREVVLTPNITKVPLTPDYIIGVANIRGNIFAVLDMEKRFQLTTEKSDDPADKKSFTLVLAHEELKLGILVREVPNALSVKQKDMDLSPNLIKDSHSKKDFIRGIVKHDDQIILLINVLNLVNKEDFKTLL